MPDIRNERTYDATPANVFACLRDPARLARWWGPAGFSNTFSVFEFRPGGNWRFTMHGPDGKNYPNGGVFRAIEENALVLLEHVCEPHFVLEIRLHPHGHVANSSRAAPRRGIVLVDHRPTNCRGRSGPERMAG